MSTIPPLNEWRASEPLNLSGAQRRALERHFEATITSGPLDNTFVVTPGNVVGTMSIDGTRIVVKPKFEIDRMLFMVAYANDPLGWKDQWSQIAGTKDLVDGMGGLFVAACDKALSRGLHRSYRQVEVDETAVRGRIRWQQQARRPAPLPIAVRYSVHDDDVTENQAIRAALMVIRRTRLTDPTVSAGIARLWRQFRDFTVLNAPLAALSRLQWNRQNQHYRPLLSLAQLVLENAMADLGDGKTSTRGFTLSVHRVFEQFIRAALREQWQLTPAQFPDNPAEHRLRLDQANIVGLRPDLAIRVREQWLFIGDVKYKRDPGKGKDSDLYQLLAYATATHLPEATLIYADGPPGTPYHVVKHSGTQLRLTRLDLSRPPQEVLSQLTSLQLSAPGTRI